MLNVSDEIKALYINDNTPADIVLTVGNQEYGPRNILSGSVTISESFNSGEVFDLSSVEKNSITFTFINIDQSISALQGQRVVASHRLLLSNDTYYNLPLGTYTITDSAYDGDYLIKCTAYDDMMKFDTIIDDWWNALTFPMTLKDLLTGLLTHLEIPYDITIFANDTYVIPARPTYFEGIKASELLGYIQEMIGGFVKINRNGIATIVGRYVTAIYPAITLYPSDTLYPEPEYMYWKPGHADQGEWTYERIVGDLTVADYEVASIDKVQVRNSENDIGYVVGTGTNAYVIEANPLFYTATAEAGQAAVQQIYDAIAGIAYHPFQCKVKSLPYIEVGDWVNITTYKGKTALSPLFMRTLNGPKLTYDTLECHGRQYREEVKASNKAMKILNRRMHEVINNIDEFSSTITNIEDEVEVHTTQIAQNAENITLTAQRIGYNNYLSNGRFDDINGYFTAWQWNISNESNTATIVDDSDFRDGYALEIVKTVTAGGSILQRINLDNINLNGKRVYFLYEYKNYGSSEAQGRVATTVIARDKDGNTRYLVNAWNSSSDGTYHQLRQAYTFTDDFYAKSIQVMPCINYAYTGTVRINRCVLLIEDADTAMPPFGLWCEQGTANLISQINVAPDGIKIQGERVDIYGVTTFHNADGTGGTTIDGSTLRSAIIETGTLKGSNSAITFDMSNTTTEYKVQMKPGQGYFYNGQTWNNYNGIIFDDVEDNAMFKTETAVSWMQSDIIALDTFSNSTDGFRLFMRSDYFSIQRFPSANEGYGILSFVDNDTQRYFDVKTPITNGLDAFTRLYLGENQAALHTWDGTTSLSGLYLTQTTAHIRIHNGTDFINRLIISPNTTSLISEGEITLYLRDFSNNNQLIGWLSLQSSYSALGYANGGAVTAKSDGVSITTNDYGGTTMLTHNVCWRQVSGVWVLAIE